MLDVRWYRQDRAAVLTALQRGERPDAATTQATGVLDELVALHLDLGIFRILDHLPVERHREGIEDALLLRTLAVLPFLAAPSLQGAAQALFGEPALLLQLGWAPLQIRQGTNARHRHPAGRQLESLPCHPDTLRDMLRRVSASTWTTAQEAAVQTLYERGLIYGGRYAVDGTALGPDRLVCLVCISTPHPIVVAWQLLDGAASEKGREASVTRQLVEQALRLGGPGCIELLLADALYADGPLLAWLKYTQGIDAVVRLPADRELYADLQRLAANGGLAQERHQYVRTVQGHKHLRVVEVTGGDDFPSWESYQAAAARYGDPDATLWGGLVRQMAPSEEPMSGAVGLVSTRDWGAGWGALLAYRERWVIEDDVYRELKEGWGVVRGQWGRDAAARRGRATLTCLAYNTVAVYRSQAGPALAQQAIRRLRHSTRPQLGPAPVIIYIAGCYAVLALEEVLAARGVPVRESLLPDLPHPESRAGPA